jgi:hypothetical protein
MIRTLADIQTFLRSASEDDLEQLRGTDEFDRLVVAEAVLDWLPDIATTWLYSPEIRWEWHLSLIYFAKSHQISWWRVCCEEGIDSSRADSVRRRWIRLRQRLIEADWLIRNGSRVFERGTREATYKLTTLYKPEDDELVSALMDAHPVGRRVIAPTPASQRLLEMSDEEFRRVVAQEVNDGMPVDGLEHRSVERRWIEALQAIGAEVMGQFGLHTHGRAPDLTRFAIPDSVLMDLPPERRREFDSRLVFLREVETRHAEVRQQKCMRSYELVRDVYEPARDELKRRHFADYARLVVEVGSDEDQDLPSIRNSLRPEPGSITEARKLLAWHGWSSITVFDGFQIWVDARKDDDRMVLTATRNKARGVNRVTWKPLQIMRRLEPAPRYKGGRLPKDPRPWLRVDPDKLDEAVRVPAVERPHYKSVIDDVDDLIPPKGFRWRHPLPIDLWQ